MSAAWAIRSVKTIRLGSLGLKVLTAYVVGALLSIALAVLAAVWVVQHDVLADVELRERAGDLASKIRFDARGNPVELDASDADLDWLYDSLPHETGYRVLDAAGNVALVSKAGEAFWPPDTSTFRMELDTFVFERNGIVLHGANQPFEHEGRQWHLQFATSERLMKLIQHKFALPYLGTGIGIFSAVLIVAFGLCAYITLRYALKPLRDISEAATAISPRSLHARLQTDTVPAEISPLVDSFNRALTRLEDGYRVQQEFLATAAHELKTPLALIRGQIELGVDEGNRAVLLQDVSHMGRQVQQLLHLAEASEPQNYEFTSVDVEALVLEVMSYLERLANQRGVRLQAVVEPGLNLPRADRGALFTLLKNLLENAIQHSRAGGVVQLRAKSNIMSVQDEGPGVPPEDLPRLFTRFWRSADRRDLGAGLGLSICREIATVHGWDLQARRAEPGMIFDLHIPPIEQAPL
jgi:two-component system, OmpR family, sensor histidine kinase QseC